MITEKIGKYTIKRHDDIDELIVRNHNAFNEYALYDAEIGNTLAAVSTHFQKLDFFLANKKMDEALQARKNMHQTFFHIFSRNNFPALQWAVLISEIDDKPVTDISVEYLKELLNQLSEEGLTQKKIRADVEAVKKKSVAS